MVYKFKIKIEGLSKPPVWRKVEVPARFTFEQFHQVIQIVFGWYNAHLWCFEPLTKGRRMPAFRIEDPYEAQDDFYWDIKVLSPVKTKLNQIFNKLTELVYVYDYGDDWRHIIKLEGVIDEERPCARYVKGKGATPPEDCGGAPGYEMIKDIFAGDDEEAKRHYREWLGFDDGEDWDPDFRCEEHEDINGQLQQIRIPVAKKAAKPTVDHVVDSKHADSPDYLSIQLLLERKKVAELRDLALMLGFRFKSFAKKAQMLDLIAGHMVRQPERIIKAAYGYELKAFLDIINGNMSVAYAELSELAYYLNRFGLIYIIDHHDKCATLHFQMDVAEVLAPLIPAELERRERDGSLLYEQLALGCANLYGYTEMYYLSDYLEEIETRTGRVLDDYELNIAMYPVVVDFALGGTAEKDILVSPFAPLGKFVPDDKHIRTELEPKRFDIDTILKYGQMPYPQFTGKEADDFRLAITKYCQAGTDPDPLMRAAWIEHQEGSATSFGNILGLIGVAPSNEQAFLNAMAKFRNSQPCWKLRGNSSEEIANQQKQACRGGMPTISIGPNLRAMGITSYDQILEMAGKGDNLPPMPSAKVGRNDPCPCGSGKKYKNCCGR